MYISASAPDAAPFSETTIGCFIRLFFWMAACIIRAIWSDAPPAPAATTISTGLVGSQAVAGVLESAGASAAVKAPAVLTYVCIAPPVVRIVCSVVRRHCCRGGTFLQIVDLGVRLACEIVE